MRSLFTKLKLLNILEKTKEARIAPNFPGGSIVNVRFRRNLNEKKAYNFKGYCIISFRIYISYLFSIMSCISLS